MEPSFTNNNSNSADGDQALERGYRTSSTDVKVADTLGTSPSSDLGVLLAIDVGQAERPTAIGASFVPALESTLAAV